jgi:toxin ParE1/3/4
MISYKIVYSETAINDLRNLADYIIYTCKAPLTSKEYAQGIVKTINGLSSIADSLPLYNRKSLTQYGFNVRRINYKKIIIIYTIHGNIVLIQRIISGSLIAEIE